jgi:hypothetical protein
VMYVLNSSSLTYADHISPQGLRDEAESASTGSPIISYDDSQNSVSIVPELPGTPPFAAATFRQTLKQCQLRLSWWFRFRIIWTVRTTYGN